MDTPKHIAIANHSSLVNDSAIAFWVEAARRQMLEHIAPCWGIAPPGIGFYGTMDKLPANQSAIVGIADDDGNAESAGYHTAIGGLVYGTVDVAQSRVPSQTMDHEIIELTINPALDRKVAGPKGRLYYVEIADPVQARQYDLEIEILGVRSKVALSDFVLPAWYGLPNPAGVDPSRTTFLSGHLGTDDDLEPFEIAAGGYQIAEEGDGEVLFLNAGQFRMNRSSHGRTRRILNRKFPVA